MTTEDREKNRRDDPVLDKQETACHYGVQNSNKPLHSWIERGMGQRFRRVAAFVKLV